MAEERPELPPQVAPAAHIVSGRLVQAAVVVCTVLSAVGIVVFLLRQPEATFNSILTEPTAGPVLSWGSFTQGLLSGDPTHYLLLVILILLAVPIVRVAVGAYYLGKARDREVAGMALGVLALLLAALFILAPLVR